MNQLATPGLGSLMARRIPAGIGQLLLFLIAFVLVVAWFVLTMIQTYNQFNNDDALPKSYGRIGAMGALLAVVSWFWSLVTSLSLLHEAKQNESQAALKNFP